MVAANQDDEEDTVKSDENDSVCTLDEDDKYLEENKDSECPQNSAIRVDPEVEEGESVEICLWRGGTR